MKFLELMIIAVGLSMDAFAVSLCKGLELRKRNLGKAGAIALFFGGFQALMPLIGWLIGKQFEKFIINFDHWVAFILLFFIGGKMIHGAFEPENCPADSSSLNIKELILLAVATSIDALAVGITFSLLKVSILPAVSVIGITTFILCLIGVGAGRRFGGKLKSKAEVAGGIVLVLIGIKIIFEHLGIL
jgi:putative Mn2+ efflux pump MntP